jgi:hypothetical protein
MGQHWEARNFSFGEENSGGNSTDILKVKYGCGKYNEVA